jgi:3-hydroxybutyryl-CoA dehydrogenase
MIIAVVGHGIMGRGVASLLKSKGYTVHVVDSRLLIQNDLETQELLQPAQLVIECVKEDILIKKVVIQKISAVVPDSYIGSCTSSISISELQNYHKTPEKFSGVHFMNPPRVIEQVELIKGHLTSEQTINFFKDFLVNIGKTPYVIDDSSGFVINALLLSMLNRAAILLDDSQLSAKEIDELMVGVCGHSMGPLATLDLIGLDTALQILTNMYEADPDKNLKPARIIIKMVEQGQLGRKTKQGFFSY